MSSLKVVERVDMVNTVTRDGKIHLEMFHDGETTVYVVRPEIVAALMEALSRSIISALREKDA